MRYLKIKDLPGALKNRSVLTVIAFLIAIDVVSLVVFFKLLKNYPVHHFDEVVPGVLYRSGQPDTERWPILRDQYHIRTVVNFRYDDPGDEAMQFEKDFCKANNIKLVRIAMDANPPSPEQLKQFLDVITDKANQPVLVHCELGRSRTGVMVAAYRVKYDGWSAKRAIDESHAFKQDMRPIYIDYLNKLDAEKNRGVAPAAGK